MTPQAGARYNQHPSAFVEHNFIQRPDEEPVSRTYQYRKVMKPMLERKRRARINRCLDELKELMVTALQAEGENVAKLEKADILELTVRHLHGLRRQGRLIPSPEGSYAEKFKAGFTHCATEVSQFIASAKTSTAQGPVEAQAGSRLLQHLSSCIRRLETTNSTPYPNVQPQAMPTHVMPNHSSQNFPAKVSFRSNNPNDIQMKNPSPHDFNIGGHHHLSQDPRRAYAPPSPPASPASTAESSSQGHAHSVWRPW